MIKTNIVSKFLTYFCIHLRCQVTLWNGDALALCTGGLPPEMLFDVIDTSNVSDHIGLLNVLVCCAPRLKLYVKEFMLLQFSLYYKDADCP